MIAAIASVRENWNENLEMVLIQVAIKNEVHKHKSHSKSYLKQDEKWARKKEDLCSHPDFQ